MNVLRYVSISREVFSFCSFKDSSSHECCRSSADNRQTSFEKHSKTSGRTCIEWATYYGLTLYPSTSKLSGEINTDSTILAIFIYLYRLFILYLAEIRFQMGGTQISSLDRATATSSMIADATIRKYSGFNAIFSNFLKLSRDPVTQKFDR